MIVTPTYHVMEMYNVHQDAKMIPLNIKSNDYTLGSEKLQAVSASASMDSLGRTHVSITNIDPKNKQDITVNVEGGSYKTIIGRLLTSDKLQDYNSFQQPDKIKPSAFKGAILTGNTLNVSMPPFSVVVLELK